uniref:Uncharacterized protein n=1 Tax=Chromera velia CCMP2878 TaxID=1169474 RepID=A0A0G4I4P9_9ALVE|eukprot:Cvel_10960.t1-p1 / transcript=Cvel_10960.t1 / gene=Cvel_10960 / organism=Chromera_velia_CCMP2878 / gene_product=hypothetical protein / transcript_product=hypothetical protein / location=Cvel_scaffold674:15045-16520(+) / protein_length=229 / sequence_SO=supercontig / SO=protein_coding / is_pseudo=false
MWPHYRLQFPLPPFLCPPAGVGGQVPGNVPAAPLGMGGQFPGVLPVAPLGMGVLPQPPTVVRLPPPSKTNFRTVPSTDVLRERLKVAPGSIIPPIKVSKREGVLTLEQRGAIGQRSERGRRKRKIRVARAGAAPSLTLGGESLYSVSAMEGEEGDDSLRSVCTFALEEAPPLSLAKEEGEGGYIFSEEEGEMVLTGTRRSPEAQKRWEEERKKEREESFKQRGEVWPGD